MLPAPPYTARVLPPTDPVPWSHGLTRQIGIFPEEARYPTDPFLWRVSTATVEVPESPDLPIPFTPLPDYDRIILLLWGHGMILDHGPHGRMVIDRSLVPHCFSGAWPTDCTLMGGGEVADFNVMVRRGRAEASVEALTLWDWETDLKLWANFHLFYCVTGGFHAVSRATGESFQVKASETLRLDGPVSSPGLGDTLTLVGTPEGSLVVGVRIFLRH